MVGVQRGQSVEVQIAGSQLGDAKELLAAVCDGAYDKGDLTKSLANAVERIPGELKAIVCKTLRAMHVSERSFQEQALLNYLTNAGKSKGK